MTNLFSMWSDNQLALLGCFAAGSGALLILAISYYAGASRSAGSPSKAHQNVIELDLDRDRRRAA